MGEGSPNIQYLQEKFAGKILESHSFRGDETIVIPREGVREIFGFLKEDPKLDFNFLTDITAVDYLGKKEPRFEVVYHLYSLRTRHRLRVKVPVPEADPTVDSVTPLWRGANWLEREVWDMFGVRFLGHPDLRRVLLYEEFQGHPLRKDYPVNQCQPLVPEREVKGTFVDQRSHDKLIQLKQKFATKG
ncbi:MAG: NADH-quinone oxidoreductase subunit C [Candidatus Binatia bacterium]